MRKVLLAFVLATICITIAYAAYQNSDWKVPEEARKLKNPVASSDAALKAARPLYFDNCAQCHGETGKGDGPEGMMYSPAPANLTDAKRMQPQTDGELFYKITEGREPMPVFKKRLTEEQRWQLVLFVRSLAPKSTEPEKTPAQPKKSGETR